jgi:hypothetical protein
VDDRELIPILKQVNYRNYLFQNLNQYSLGNIVLKDASSNIDGVLFEIQVFLVLS